jgi:indole-3-glycerol phosphate synthase
MPTILDSIVAVKKEEVRRLRTDKSIHGGRTSEKRPFIEAIAQAQGLGIIAEVKKASPSKGIISADFDPKAIAEKYEKGDAAAISVLTDETYFKGALSYLAIVKETVSLPVLRKDFIIDPVQVRQSAASNADAMLLIAAILGKGQMEELYSAALELGLDPLIEIHSMKECERVLALSPTPRCIGINNRDLRTFETNIAVTLSIVPHIPQGIVTISESGIQTRAQAETLLKAGVRGLLVGESLMRSKDPSDLIKELRCVDL